MRLRGESAREAQRDPRSNSTTPAEEPFLTNPLRSPYHTTIQTTTQRPSPLSSLAPTTHPKTTPHTDSRPLVESRRRFRQSAGTTSRHTRTDIALELSGTRSGVVYHPYDSSYKLRARSRMVGNVLNWSSGNRGLLAAVRAAVGVGG